MSVTESNQSKTADELPPLNLTCTSTKCEAGLHCFLQDQRKRKLVAEHPLGRGGRCRSCGADLVEWARLYQRDLADVAYTFAMLKYEFIRHHFWHIELDQKSINHALKKGRRELCLAAEKRLRQSVGSAEPFRDGMQTPKQGRALYYAQHATATCCRRCIEEWHGIRRGEALTDEQIAYFTELLMLFIDERLPQLEDEGIKTKRQPSRKTSSSKNLKPKPAVTSKLLRNE